MHSGFQGFTRRAGSVVVLALAMASCSDGASDVGFSAEALVADSEPAVDDQCSDLQTLFEAHDLDGSGEIGIADELSAESAFSAFFDSNADGKVNMDEFWALHNESFAYAPYQPQDIEALWDLVDTNADGALTPEDWSVSVQLSAVGAESRSARCGVSALEFSVLDSRRAGRVLPADLSRRLSPAEDAIFGKLVLRSGSNWLLDKGHCYNLYRTGRTWIVKTTETVSTVVPPETGDASPAITISYQQHRVVSVDAAKAVVEVTELIPRAEGGGFSPKPGDTPYRYIVPFTTDALGLFCVIPDLTQRKIPVFKLSGRDLDRVQIHTSRSNSAGTPSEELYWDQAHLSVDYPSLTLYGTSNSDRPGYCNLRGTPVRCRIIKRKERLLIYASWLR